MSPIERAEKFRVVLGGLAGLVTAVAVLGFWLVRGGGGVDPSADDALTASDTMVGQRVTRATTGPIIGAFEKRVDHRLRASDPVVRGVQRLSIRARDVVWSEPDGRVFARAASAVAVLDAGAATHRDIVLDDVVLADGRLWLRQEGDRWNYEVVLAELLEDDPNGADEPERLVLLRDTRLTDAFVEVQQTDGTFTLEQLDATLPAIWLSDPSRPEPELSIATATAVLNLPEREPIALAAEDAVVRLPEDVVAFTVDRLRIDGAQLAAVAGTWNPDWAFPGLDARGRALDVPLGEFARYAPERLPDEGTATFDWQIRPLTDERIEVAVAELRLRTGASNVSGAATFRLGGPEPPTLRAADLVLDPLQVALVESLAGRTLPYHGQLTGTVRGSDGVIDVEGLAALYPVDAPADSFSTSVLARVAIADGEFRLLGAEAELRGVPLASLRVLVPGLPVAGTLDGTVTLEGAPDREPLAIDLRLRSGLGIVTATGTLDLTGSEPVYDVDGRVIGLELTEIFAPRVPPVALTGTFSIVGRGVDPQTARARVDVAGRFTGWESGAGDRLRLAARFEAGTAVLDTAALELATLTADASGEWRFAEPGAGALRYAIDVASLQPWEPYLPGPVSGAAEGRLNVLGSLAGSLETPRVEGEVLGEALVLGDWQFGRLDAQYTGVLRDSVPELVLTATGRDIETATAGGYATASLDLRLTPPSLDVTLRAERTAGGVVEVVADGTIPRSGRRQVTVRSLVADIEGGRWELTEPAVISWTDEVIVEGFELVEADTGGRVFVAGTVWPLQRLDAELDVSDLPVGEVQQLFGFAPQVSGRLGLQGSILVEDGAPTALLAFQLDSGAIRRVPIPSLVGAVRYENGLVEGRALAALDTAGRVALELTLPAEASVDSVPHFGLVPEGVVSGRLVAQQLTLASFAEVSPYVREVEGRANGEVALSGTVAAPQLGGQMTVTNGAATVIPLNQRYTGITADVALADRRLTINSLQAYSGGPVTVTGDVVFESLAEPVANLTVRAQGFRALHVANQEDAAFAGTLTVQGPIPDVVISGQLSVSDGYVPIPAPSGPAADFSDLPAVGGVGERSWSDAIRIEQLAIDVANDVWFSGEGMRAQLRGGLTVSKSGDAIRVQGTLEGERGSYTLRAGPIVRQFQIAHAQVRFLGTPEPDPALDLTARRVVFDPSARRIEIEVHIGGTLSNPTLSLASADLATVPESELLSFLFFGRPSFELGGGGLPGEVIIQETFVSGFAEFAGLELERALVEDLGLSFDLFQIRFAGTGTSSGYGADVVLGWELGSEFFLTVESGLGALFQDGGNAANIWAIRLEWAFDEDSQARIGLEPVRLTGYSRSFSLGVEPQRNQQFFLEVRRRWTY